MSKGLVEGPGQGGEPVAGLLSAVSSARPDADLELIVRAYLVAERWHRGQLRKSGDPYITHPVAVAVILAGMGADDPTLCAALLHDVPEDTGCTIDMLRAEFGDELAGLVEQVQALDARGDDEAVGLAGDRRALMIKLADRLHNMRTIGWLPSARQVDKSLETLRFQVPVARALGADGISAELADLASATLREHHYQPPTASGQALCASAVLLPARSRARWREEWLAELDQLPTRTARAAFAAQMIIGISRMAIALRARTGRSREGRTSTRG